MTKSNVPIVREVIDIVSRIMISNRNLPPEKKNLNGKSESMMSFLQVITS